MYILKLNLSLAVSICFSLFANFLHAQTVTYGFAKQYGGGSGEIPWATETDPSGNIYVTGMFHDSIDFDPGTGSFMIYALPMLTPDGFICKLDSSGNPLWAHQIGGQRHDEANDVAVDSFGNVYVCGHFRDTVDFDPGPGIFHLISTKNNLGFFQEDGYIVKYNASGQFIWAKQIAGPKMQKCNSLDVDPTGNVYVVGASTDTTDLDPGTGLTLHVAASVTDDMFLVKLDSAGTFVWGFGLGAGYADRAAAVQIDPSGNILLGGTFGQTVDFDPGSATVSLNSGNSEDGFIAKYSPAGNLIWVIQQGSNFGGSNVEHLRTDAAGNIYAVGLFSAQCDFNNLSGTDTLRSNGIYDSFIAKYSSAGNYIWVKGYGSDQDDRWATPALDGFGNIFITGSLMDTTDFDPGVGISLLTSFSAISDVYILRLDTSGSFVSVSQIGSTSNDWGRAINVDAFNRVITTGMFMGTADFDTGPGTDNLTSYGSQDIFITIHHIQVITSTQNADAHLSDVQTYPNPATKYIQVKGLPEMQEFTYTLLDTHGREISSGISTPESIIQTDTVSPGIYLLKIHSGSLTHLQKIIIE